ncbi:carbohydrate kinase, FGGY family [Mycobacterium intracellulare]|nr:carbohydrate kinase, FGGY family [Mycobacterium intracellulare]
MANHALAGDAVIDIATAATAFPLFDGTGWDPAACAERGARIEQMPRVESMGAVVGEVRGSGAALATGAIDALCEQIVAGADRDGDVLVMCGTTLIVWTTISEPRQMPGLWTIPHTTPGKSQIGGASNAGGLFLGWVDRVVAQADPTAVEPGRVPVWSPYLRGERSPFHDPDRRGLLEALDLTHDAAALRRAAYEASGFVVRQLIELSAAPVSRIVATGGGTRVGPWLQAIADATGRPVEVSAVAEGAALGPPSSPAWPPAWRRRSPTPPVGCAPSASSSPIPYGRRRSRTATTASYRWQSADVARWHHRRSRLVQ